MNPKQTSPKTMPASTDGIAQLLKQYGCGPIPFAGTENAHYERHLVFDQAINVDDADPRTRFEAVARSIRDVLSQRWVRTEETLMPSKSATWVCGQPNACTSITHDRWDSLKCAKASGKRGSTS